MPILNSLCYNKANALYAIMFANQFWRAPMNLSAISHRSLFTDCYARNSKEIVVNIRTGKDITAVNLLAEDPYAYGISGDSSAGSSY